MLILSSFTTFFQSVVYSINPNLLAASATLSSGKPQMLTSLGIAGGGQNIYGSFFQPFECAFPIKACPIKPIPISGILSLAFFSEVMATKPTFFSSIFHLFNYEILY